MQNEDMNPRLDPAERELEAALARVTPARTSMQRDELMYQAGRRSTRAAMRRWRSVAAMLVVGMGVSLALRPIPRDIERIVYVPQPATVVTTPNNASSITPGPDVGPFSMAALQHVAIEKGVDALPFMSSGVTVPRASSPAATPSLRPTLKTLTLEGDPS